MNKLEIEVQALRQKLLLSEKRYEIAMGLADVTVFEYDLLTKRILTQHSDFEVFGMPAEVEEGPEEVLASGIISKHSFKTFRELYRKIEGGAVSAKAIIHANALDGSERVLELVMVNIFDQDGRPIHAVGVRKDITDTNLLKKEKEYGGILMLDSMLAYEANISRNLVYRFDHQWMKDIDVGEDATYDEVIDAMCKTVVAQENVAQVASIMARTAIIRTFEEGQKLISFQFRRKTAPGQLTWFEQSVNIIRDELSGDINIRCYLKNIQLQKEKENKAVEGRRFYESLVYKSSTVYEFDITENRLLSGGDELERMTGIFPNADMDTAIKVVCETMVHPDDYDIFKDFHQREKIISDFSHGKSEDSFEFRITHGGSAYYWVRTVMHVFEDTESGNIKCFCYSQDIDEEKKKQLELIFKSQHDLLTGLYNKATLEEKIVSFLNTSQAKGGVHAFFIIDLDYFKAINDNFGHAFGDAVLFQTASMVKSIFREDDILGRIGGDEFVIFMKNIQDEGPAIAKAEELCANLAETFTQEQAQYKLSVSVGIALYGAHGTTYSELYHHSDVALYHSKENGRSRFSIYDKGMRIGVTNVKVIDADRQEHVKIFDENISEFVFRILYETTDKVKAINSVLELVGKHYSGSRIYVFEDSEDKLYTSNTFEWCAEGIKPRIAELQNVSCEEFGDYRGFFNSEGYLYINDTEMDSPAARRILTARDTKRMLQFGIIRNGEQVGIIGFDQDVIMRNPTEKDLSGFKNLASVLGVFITEMRAVERVVIAKRESDDAKQLAFSILAGLDSYAYLCNPQSYRIMFVNSRMMRLTHEVEVGDICYKAFWGRTSICENCHMEALAKKKTFESSSEVYMPKKKIWLKVTASWIDWLGGKMACLVEGVDITKYMPKE